MNGSASAPRRLRIAHVLPALTKGGGERVAVELMRELARAGHDVSCIAGWEAPPPGVRHLLPPEVPVEYVAARRESLARQTAGAAAWVWAHRDRLRTVDVVHCHLTYGAVLATFAALWRDVSRGARPAVVETYHAVGMGIPRHRERLNQRLAARRDALVLMAEDATWRRFAARHPRLLVRTILNGAADPRVDLVDAAERRAYRARIGVPETCRLVVGTVSLLRPDRRPWIWVPIFAEIARAIGPDVHFVMAGGGPEETRLRALIDEAGLTGRVHITGTVDRVREPLSIMDLYVTINIGPVTGVAALEAALSGLPIVAMQFTDGYEAVDTDWIWSSTRGEAIAAHIVALLRDDDARRALAARQSAYAHRHHSTEAMAAAYEDVYRAVLARRGIA